MLRRMDEQICHHYPPDLVELLVCAIPRLIKGKAAVLNFLAGCGVASQHLVDLRATVARDRDSITKFDIVRRALHRINDQGDSALRARREIIKRVTQWDDFSTGYPNQQMEAKGYVAEIQRIVGTKDSFTRMAQAEEQERLQRAAIHREKVARQQARAQERAQIRADLAALFAESDAHKRGTALESVLNRLFESEGILIREAFRRVGERGEGVVEQIDGVVELDGHLYLVEVKWYTRPLGVPEVSEHLVRVHNRRAARGLLISHSGYTAPAVAICRESLALSVFVLARLEEFVLLLERDGTVLDLLRSKVRAAVIDKMPLV